MFIVMKGTDVLYLSLVDGITCALDSSRQSLANGGVLYVVFFFSKNFVSTSRGKRVRDEVLFASVRCVLRLTKNFGSLCHRAVIRVLLRSRERS